LTLAGVSVSIVPLLRVTAMKIMSVDDNVAHCYCISRVLRHAGFKVFEAHTAAEALAIADRERPQLALLDIHLPDLTGYDLLTKLKQNPQTKSMGIILHTASEPTPVAKTAAERLGADGFLTYPMESEELLIVVRGTLMRVSSLRDANDHEPGTSAPRRFN
jgi:CheY-like chemotaxis protein